MRDNAGDQDHVFAVQFAGQLNYGLAAFGSCHDLGFSVAITQVDKYPPTVVSGAVDPPAECHRLADVLGPQLTAMMSPQQSSFLPIDCPWARRILFVQCMSQITGLPNRVF
jgi:hypothetical protein